MTKAVFMTKRGQTLDDDVLGERYHFPETYLADAKRAVGDWCVYYETASDGGRWAYFGVAYVRSVDQDPQQAGRYYARLSDYVEFPMSVAPDASVYEPSLLKSDGKLNKSKVQRAVRLVPDTNFYAIVRSGFNPLSDVLRPAFANQENLATRVAQWIRRIAKG